jgi:membrane-associated phospholipid phosphatase
VRWSEWLALAFFVWLLVAAWIRRLPGGRSWLLTACALAMCAVVAEIARRAAPGVRDWCPPFYLLIGYYLSGWLFVAPSPAFERWLISWDRRLFGSDPAARFARWPPSLLAFLDIVYVFCFLLVPGGFAVLSLAGQARLADQYWTMVLAAEFGSFAPLAIVQSRPPWLLEPRAPHPGMTRRFASAFVREATIGANTFPSGHVAGSFAVALAVVGAVPPAGFVLLALAVAISIGCIAGRYHYAIDAAAGAALAALAAMAVL